MENKFKKAIDSLLQTAKIANEKIVGEFAEAAAMLNMIGSIESAQNFADAMAILKTMGSVNPAPAFVSLESRGITNVDVYEKYRFVSKDFFLEKEVHYDKKRFILHDETFEEEILSKANTNKTFRDGTVETFTINKKMNDIAIAFEFGRIPVFTIDNFLYYLERMIREQKRFPVLDQKAPLTMCASYIFNIFYVQVADRIIVVCISTHNYTKWQVYVHEFGYMQEYHEGSRFFVPISVGED